VRRQRIDVVMKMWALSPNRRSVLQLLAAMLATPLALPTPTSAAVSRARGLTRRGKKGKSKGKGKGKSKNKKKECTGFPEPYIQVADTGCYYLFGGLADLVGAAECALCFEACAPFCTSCDFDSLSACEANCRNQGYAISTSCGTTGRPD
jgi:hypothetical protein